MIIITMRDGNIRTYNADEYTDYEWRNNAFIVIKGNQWIGIYNWECVKSVEYEETKS